MGSSECWDQPRASATGQSNVQFAAKTPIAVTVIGFCPITRTFVARQPSREGRRRPHRRRTGERLWPGLASAGASSAVGLTPPDLVGSGERRHGQGGRHRSAAARPQLVHLSVRSQGGCPLSVNRGVLVIAGPLILAGQEQQSVPLDDVTEARYILSQRRDSQPWVARKAGDRLMPRRPGNLICDLPPKRQ